MIALTLSSVVIILVSKTFLVQNQYYSTQIQATAAHDNARAATELVASELRSVMRSGITIAGARTLTIRTPMTMVVACYTGGGVSVHVDGGVSGLATDEVAGVARRNEATGAWAYGNPVWSSLTLGGGALQPPTARTKEQIRRLSRQSITASAMAGCTTLSARVRSTATC